MNYEQRIIKHFSGIDAEREKVLNQIRVIESQKDVYNPSHIGQVKEDGRKHLIADRQERAAKAKQEIEKIREELQAKQFKNPYDEIKSNIITVQDKLLIEMKQNRKMQVLKAELEAVDTAEEMKALLEEFGEYEEFSRIINLEIKKRAKETGSGDFIMLQSELNQEPKEFVELIKMEQWVTFFGNTDMHPSGLDKGHFRDVSYERLV